MTSRRQLSAVFLGVLAPLVMAGGCDRCSKPKDEAPPPLPPTTASVTATPTTTLTIEDAGEAVSDAADADAAKKPGPYVPAASLKACCAALAQNAANAPPPTSVYLLQAAAACNAAVAQGKDKASVIGIVSGALKGAGMPGACR